MPGLTGIIGVPGDAANRQRVESMVSAMLHEKSYSSGVYVNESIGVWVGWTSHRGSFSDGMPVWNETGDIGLIFSGEDFADPSEVDGLKSRGHSLGAGKGSYLVHLYEEIGLRFLEKLNGWFSGVLVDLRERKICLFNDRYGLNRIYYHETPQALYFSSEAKSILKVLPHLRRIDLQSLGECFSCGCVLENRSLFSGVDLLPGGSAWVFSPGERPRKEVYFRPAQWESQSPCGPQEYQEKLSGTFSRILSRYLRGPEQVGVSLTGGVDSRMIMAWLPTTCGRLPCYTFAGMDRDSRDVRIARAVAKLCRQPHTVIRVNGNFFDEFSALAERTVYISDGAMDVSGAAELYVNRLARGIAPVRLTGNYGGEVLRGLVAFKPRSVCAGLLEPAFAGVVRAAGDTYHALAQGHRTSFIAFRQVPWHHYNRLAVEQSQLTLRSPYLDNDLVALAYQAPADLSLSKDPSLRLVADGNPALARLETDRGLVPLCSSLRARVSNLCQEFTVRAEYAYDYGMPPWLAAVDHIAAPLHFEKLFLGRHKFCHFRVWYRDQLSAYVKDVLLDSRTRARPFLQGARLEEMVRSHTNGCRNHTLDIHRILTTELVYRRLIEG
jgi:asparagine synthase (glutamine-hydrolysing)